MEPTEADKSVRPCANNVLNHEVALLLGKQKLQTKICNFGVQILVQQNVGCFYVLVNDFGISQGVKVVQAM
jgi:hypothetical protein